MDMPVSQLPPCFSCFQTTEEFLSAYNSLNVKSPRSMYAQLTYDSVWSVALTLRQAMERTKQAHNNTQLEDFKYRSGKHMYDDLFDIMGNLEFLGVSVSAMSVISACHV